VNVRFCLRTIRAIGDALKISPSGVSKWKKLRRETGSLKHGKIGGHKTSVLSGATAQWLRERMNSGPFTLRKLTAELAARGIKTHQKTVWLFVHAEGLSFKKTVLPTEQSRPDIARKRARWKAHQHRIDARRLVFLDETYQDQRLSSRRRGWRPCAAGDSAGSGWTPVCRMGTGRR
jgi:transposase